jgi:CheY-like chemotaxis protein
MMPVMTRYSVLETIRTEGKDTTTKIIMATSMSGSHTVQDCAKLGIQGYLVKPFKPKEIATRIIQCIQQT